MGRGRGENVLACAVIEQGCVCESLRDEAFEVMGPSCVETKTGTNMTLKHDAMGPGELTVEVGRVHRRRADDDSQWTIARLRC